MMFLQNTCNDNRQGRTQRFPSRRRAVGEERPGRRGTVLILTTLMVVVLVGMLAFAIDVGYLANARTELQRTADVCALAAAELLPSETDATVAARAIADQNRWSPEVKISDGDASHGSDLDPMKIQYGLWDRDTATFTTPTPGGSSTNAVRVTLRRSEATGNPIRLFFGRIFGASQADATASATAYYDRWLCGPFVGIDWLSIPGTPMADSFDTRKGAYDWSTARDRGSICSDGPIGVDGAALIKGNARSGEDDTVTLTGGATVTRGTGERKGPLNLPLVDDTAASITNNNANVPLIPQGNSWVSPLDGNRNFLLDGSKSIVLPAGTYWFNDFVLEGQSQFSVSGPTTIYITGDMRRAGGTSVTNPANVPGNLKFLMTGGIAEVTSNNAFHGVIYAPNTAVTIDGGSEFYGVVVGKTLTVTGGGSAHYDESLEMEEVQLPRRTTLVD